MPVIYPMTYLCFFIQTEKYFSSHHHFQPLVALCFLLPETDVIVPLPTLSTILFRISNCKQLHIYLNPDKDPSSISWLSLKISFSGGHSHLGCGPSYSPSHLEIFTPPHTFWSLPSFRVPLAHCQSLYLRCVESILHSRHLAIFLPQQTRNLVGPITQIYSKVGHLTCLHPFPDYHSLLPGLLQSHKSAFCFSSCPHNQFSIQLPGESP